MIYEGYFDGSATPNPGEMIIGGVIKGRFCNVEELILKYSIAIGHGTNNESEYNSLIELLTRAKKAGIKALNIKGDSLLVVNQVNGLWKTKDPRMKKLKITVLKLLEDFDYWNLMHVLRGENKEADSLTRK